MNCRTSIRSHLLLLSLILSIIAADQSHWLRAIANPQGDKGNSSTPAKVKYKRGALHRLDFVVAGSSCVVCLRRVEQKIGHARSVLKAAVSIYPPHAAVVIYDSRKSSAGDIFKSLSGEPVKIQHLSESTVEKIPQVLIPDVHLGTAANEQSSQTSSSPHALH